MKRSIFVFHALLTVFGVQLLAADLHYETTVSGVATRLNAVANGGTANFVAVGANSTTLVSPLGGSGWTQNVVPTAGLNLNAITYGNGMFVAGAQSRRVFSSPNGAGWVDEGNAFPAGLTLAALGYTPGSGGTFVALPQAVSARWADADLTTWHNAVVAAGSLSEQFRAVTPLGADGFAACGIRGVIRLSQDAGRNWSVARAYNNTQPDLFGIAAQGATVVAVGESGRIWVSMNSGTSFTLVTPAPTDENLNAVVSTGNGFIAVGDQGVILASSDGSTWVVQEMATVNALYGVTFATNGPLQGVVVAVGNNGTIVLGGPIPDATVSTGNKTKCFEAGAFPTLSVTAATFATVDWYDAASGGNKVATGTTSFTPTANTTFTYYAQARDTRTGFTNVNRTPVTLSVNPPLFASAAASATICADASMNLGGAATGGTPGYTYSWSPATFLDNPNVANPTATPPPGSTTVYTLTVTDSSAAPGNCTAQTNVTVTVNPVLAASATPSATICAGASMPLNGAASGGTPGYSYSWSPSTFLDNPNIANPTATPPAGSTTVYTLTVRDSSVAVGNCTAQANVTVTVNPTLTASAAASATICAGASMPLNGSASGGTPGYTYSWSPATYLDNPNIANPTATPPAGTATTYTLVVTDSSAAAADCTANANVTVTVNPVLIASAVVSTTICAGASVALNGSAAGGTGPYTYSWSPAIYLSDANIANPTATPPPGTTNTYTLTVTDASAAAGHCTAQTNLTVKVNAIVAPPVASTAQTNAAGTAGTLAVSVPNGITVDWFAAATGGTPLAQGTNSFTPTNRNAGVYTFYAEARDIQLSCVSSNRTVVTLTLEERLAASLVNGTNIVLNWFGDYNLETTSVLTNPLNIVWTPLTNGTAGSNNAVSYPATNKASFFRLKKP